LVSGVGVAVRRAGHQSGGALKRLLPDSSEGSKVP
jgi:hypothetical protein